MFNPLGNILDIIPAILPLDLQTARTGDRVKVSNYQGVLVVILKGAGTAADDPTFTFQQHAAASGGTPADLATITKYWKKQGTLTAVAAFTEVTQSAAATIVGNSTSAEDELLLVVDIPVGQFTDGYEWLTVACSDVGTNAQLGAALYIPYGPRYQTAPADLPSAIS